jgi:hypothetical protein
MGNTEVALSNGSSNGAYTLSNSGVHALDRFNALSCLYDPETSGYNGAFTPNVDGLGPSAFAPPEFNSTM